MLRGNEIEVYYVMKNNTSIIQNKTYNGHKIYADDVIPANSTQLTDFTTQEKSAIN